MTLGLLFWILMILWALFGFGFISAGPAWTSSLLLFVLLAVLGWQVFGPAIRRGGPQG